jgi:hypothetical protein
MPIGRIISAKHFCCVGVSGTASLVSTIPFSGSTSWANQGQRGDLDDWFAPLGNDEGLALGRRFHQFRELRLGFVNIDNFHGFGGDVMLSLTSYRPRASLAYLERVEHRDA